MIIHLPQPVVRLFSEEALKAVPEEACGLLLGYRDDKKIIIQGCCFTDNVATEGRTHTFEVDPTVHLKLQREARRNGPQVIGVWHSHPNGEARLSKTDKALSIETGWLWVVTAFQNNTVDHSAYVCNDRDSHVFHDAKILLT